MVDAEGVTGVLGVLMALLLKAIVETFAISSIGGTKSVVWCKVSVVVVSGELGTTAVMYVVPLKIP